MDSAEEFDRHSPFRVEGLRSANIRTNFPGIHEVQTPSPPRQPMSRVVGSPLPTGTASEYRTAPPPGRALPGAQDESGSGRAMDLLKSALPFVQKLLPLLDGNFGSAIANVFGPRSAPPAPPVDLTPVHNQVSDLQLQQADLRTQVVEQNSAIKRVEEQLQAVREASDRNSQEQQDLVHDIKAVGRKVNAFALMLFIMLLVSMLLNLALFMHIKQVLP